MEAAQLIYSIQGLNPEAVCLLTEYAAVSLISLQQMQRKQHKVHQKLDVHSHLHLTAVVHTFEGAVAQTDFEDWLRAPSRNGLSNERIHFLHTFTIPSFISILIRNANVYE